MDTLDDNFVAVGNLEFGGPPPNFADGRVVERDPRGARQLLGYWGSKLLSVGPRAAQPPSE